MTGYPGNLYSQRTFTTWAKITSPEADHAGGFRPFPHKDQLSHHRRADDGRRSRTAVGSRLSSADRPIHAQYV
ncbi:hypothetical protein BB31_12035 [Amycolatopsis lurida NRRL 2430]|uniref:Uncharacterized protein n=1 Tax=Amycolatopsis lurida NRRL 2430 TaxID=1460371 RepID=A0A2P2FWM1_AMYLU|nr:hypothetical protein BB31_12035 [Amycolatopsis lurida NRRL 2430]